MSQLGIGIVGTGMIAGVIADAIAKSKNARLTAVSSRRLENAQQAPPQHTGLSEISGSLARPNQKYGVSVRKRGDGLVQLAHFDDRRIGNQHPFLPTSVSP